MTKLLDEFSAIAPWALAGLVITFFGTLLTMIATKLEWRAHKNTLWKFVAIGQLVVLVLGIVFTLIAAVADGLENRRLHNQVNAQGTTINEQGTAIHNAQTKVDTVRGDIRKLNATTRDLTIESQNALAVANTDSQTAKAVSDRVSRLSTDTQKRLRETNAHAQQAAYTAQQAASSAQHAASSATDSRDVARAAASQAASSRRDALAAAAKAGVFHIPDNVAKMITLALKSVLKGSADIACAPGMETPCDDFGRIFREADWAVSESKDQGWYGPNTDPNRGLYVTCDGPDRSTLALSLSAALQQLDVVVKVAVADNKTPTATNQISVAIQFLAPAKTVEPSRP